MNTNKPAMAKSAASGASLPNASLLSTETPSCRRR